MILKDSSDKRKLPKEFAGSFEENSEACNKLNKTIEKLRARLYTLAEASLPPPQADSFKKAIRDYTSEAWNILTELLRELEGQESFKSEEESQ